MHHVSVQLGSYDPSGKHAVPGLLPDLHGRYRVNLGVFVPEMNRSGAQRSTWINDYNCQLRWGLGDFLPGGIERFNSAEQVLDAWHEQGPRAFGPITPEAAVLDVADLLVARRRRDEAERLLETYVESVNLGHHTGHKQYLRKYLTERDFGRLAQQVT